MADNDDYCGYCNRGEHSKCINGKTEFLKKINYNGLPCECKH